MSHKMMASNYLTKIQYKMEIVNRVSAFHNYQVFPDVIAVRTKQASENSEPIKSE